MINRFIPVFFCVRALHHDTPRFPLRKKSQLMIIPTMHIAINIQSKVRYITSVKPPAEDTSATKK